MGSSYKKQATSCKYREIPIDNTQPWEFAECLYESYCQLSNKVLDLEEELVLLKNKRHPKNPSPKQPKQHQKTQTLPILADASCQTWDHSAMEIELQESSSRRMIRCTSLRKKIFYTKVYTKKHIKREGMEIEKEKKAHHPKPEKKIPKDRQKFYKVFVRKEGMEIESKTSQLNETPPKRTERNKKTRHDGTPKELAPRRKKPKKNTPKKDLSGSGLKLIEKIKILTEPIKVTVLTDFFNVLSKSQSCAKIKLVPDPT